MRLNKIGKTTLFIFIILLIALLFLLRDESNRPIHIDGADTDKTIGRRSNSAIVINENDGVSGELSKTELWALNTGAILRIITSRLNHITKSCSRIVLILR